MGRPKKVVEKPQKAPTIPTKVTVHLDRDPNDPRK